ncbi:MAG: biotin/lipoate A/B protein ligase family protein [Pirellulales bacterium]
MPTSTRSTSLVSTDRNMQLQIDPPAAGDWNMAVDDDLLRQAVDRSVMTLRFYQWKEPTVSLGYFQRLADRDEHSASRNLPVVRRTTGGGALVHDVELTYSLVLPSDHPSAANPCCLYDLVHGELIATLGAHGIHAQFYRDVEPNESGGTNRGEPFLCFERRAAVDVVIDGVKVAGSAQRRQRGAVLQHGSVLLARSTAAPELPGMLELTGKSIPPVLLARQWSRQIAHRLNGVLEPANPDRPFRQRVEQLVVDRYASSAWTGRRS